jgi:hypothetical protein
MAPVAAYAALLDGNVEALFLADLPATLDEPSEKDGTGPAVEMLGALRIADLPVAAGLQCPRPLLFVGKRPETYSWAEDVYERLGKSDNVATINNLSGWKDRR